MSKTYIVIAAKLIKNSEGVTTIVYDDTTEKFIEDLDGIPSPTASEKYEEYLKTKFLKVPGYTVVRSELTIITTIDIQSMLAEDAKEKLSEQEFEALKSSLL